MNFLNTGLPAEPPGLAGELSQTLTVDGAGEILLLDTPRAPKPLLGLGCAWVLDDPVNIEVLDQERLDALALQHASLVQGLPLGSVVQTLMLVRPSTQAPRWERRRLGLPPTPLVDVQRAHMASGLPHTAGPRRARLRDICTLVTLRVPLPDVMGDVVTLLKTVLTLPSYAPRACKAFLQEQLHTMLPMFVGMQRNLENALHSCGHTVQRLDATALGEYLALFVDPLGPLPPILPEYPLRTQVLRQYAQAIPGGWGYGEWHRDTATFDEHSRNQVLTLNKLPLETYPGMCSSPRMPRDSEAAEPLALWDIWDGPLLLAINAVATDQAKEDGILETKGVIAGWQRKFSVRNKKIKKAIDKVTSRRLTKHTAMGAARVHLVLWGDAPEVKLGVESVQREANRFKLDFLPEPDLGATLFLQALPLGCNPDFPPEWALKRLRKLELPNLLDLLAVFGAMRGTETATHFALNGRGEEVSYDNFDTMTNAHRMTMGNSGAGKTYNNAKEVSEVLSVGDIVMLLDPLANYQALAAFWNGVYVRLNFETPPCINPFYGPLDITHQSFIAATLNEMAGNAADRLRWTGFNVLSDAIAYFADTWQEGEATLSVFVEQVLSTGAFTANEENKAMAREIATRLGLYYGRGIYAKFFDGPNTFQFGDRLTVIEFKELEKAEKLKAVLAFGLMNLFRLKTKSVEWSGKRKHIKADELWAFLDYEETAQVFKTMILTGRNDGLSIDFMTQLKAHLDSPVGRVIRGIVSKVLFLEQDPSEFPGIAEAFNLSKDEQMLVRRVKRYAAWNTGYLRLSHRPGGLIRIFGDPVTHLLMTQDTAIRAERETLLAAHPGEEHAAIMDWLQQKGVLTHG